MRWLIVHPGPNFSVADVHNGWSEALASLGEQVMEFNLDARLTFYDSALIGETDGEPDSEGRRPVRKALTIEQAVDLATDGLLSAAYRWWPDVILCVSAFFVPPFVMEVMRSRGHRIVMLFTEAPYQDGQQLEMAKYADIALLNDPATLAEYQAVSPVAEYMPHSYRPAIHHPGRPVGGLEHDLAFTGTGFPSRIEFFEAMDLAGLRVALGGFWGRLSEDSPLRQYLLDAEHGGDACMDNTDTAGLYRAAATGINFYRREGEEGRADRGWACGPREIEMAACGLWFARDARPESDALFPMLPSFTSPAEASDLIRWAVGHPDERAGAVMKARAAIEDRTFENAAKRLLRLLDQQKGTP
jgi:spore maturation protein CgeB